ncbi:MAG: hypothetical protein C4305_05460 [Thermoleophilia bacterium]
MGPHSDDRREGDSLRTRLVEELREAFAGDDDGLRMARAACDAAVAALRRRGADAATVSSAAINAVAPRLREARRVIGSVERALGKE